MTFRHFISLLIASFIVATSYTQNPDYARSLIDTLASPAMFGRGYNNKGDSIAAAFIATQFRHWGLQPFGEDYYQPFTLSVNTFPGTVSLRVNEKELLPGSEFVVGAASHADSGEYQVKVLHSRKLNNSRRLNRFNNRDHSASYILFMPDKKPETSRDTWRRIDSMVQSNAAQARGVIIPRSAISWHVHAREMGKKKYTTFSILENALPRKPKKINVNIETSWLEDYVTYNVIAWIPGKIQPDSFLVVSAHYDHLGMMGTQTLFPGANDNASGTAMLLDLARHYSLPENQPVYSIAFMAFAGEETGLLGSKFYTENPYFPLEKIKFLINLDMVGTGSDGLLVFNGTTDSLRFETMRRINEEQGYLKELRIRGESRSSDHYYFYKNGVPTFFLLTIGNEHRHYHNIYDTGESVPLTKYSEVFRLITDFFSTF